MCYVKPSHSLNRATGRAADTVGHFCSTNNPFCGATDFPVLEFW